MGSILYLPTAAIVGLKSFTAWPYIDTFAEIIALAQ